MALKLPDKQLPWPICWDGVKLVAEAESCRLTAYQDAVGVWTCGWGETDGVTQGTEWNQAEADARLCCRLREFSDQVRGALADKAATANDNQIAAMTSLAYNIGVAAFLRSSVLKAHLRGDALAAAAAFKLWNKAGGKVLAGLVTRRANEAALYLKPTASEAALKHSVDPAPATPDADANCERPVLKSSTLQSGAAAAGASLLAAAGQLLEQAEPVARSAQVVAGNAASASRSLAGIPLSMLALFCSVAATIAGGLVVWRIVLRKREGKS